MASLSLFALLVVANFAVPSFGVAVGRRDSVPAGYVAAPYYPAPYGGWTADWAESYAKAKALVDSMTLAEKTNISAGTGLFMGKTFVERQPIGQNTCKESLTRIAGYVDTFARILKHVNSKD
jgi:beta-glucosidase